MSKGEFEISDVTQYGGTMVCMKPSSSDGDC